MKKANIKPHLFTLRIWPEIVGDGRWEWRGRVQALPNGEAFYFREWQTLVAQLQELLSGHIPNNDHFDHL